MGFNISSLPDFAQEGKAFIVKSVLESQTIKTLTGAGSFDPTAKGLHHIQLMDNDVYFQDGSTCGFTPTGGSTLTQATMTIKDIKLNESYCSRDLEKKWAVGELQKGQDYNELVFLNDIVEDKTNRASYEIEKLIWQGDTGLTASTNLKYVDGFLKQIKAGSYLPLTGATSSATVLGKLQSIALKMPVEVSSQQDFRIFIGQEVYNQYVADLATLNIYKPTSDDTVFGTNVKLQIANGLNSTGYVVAARYRNLQAGGEMNDSNINFRNWYSNDDDLMYLSMRFSLGVAPVYIQEIGLVKIA